MNVSEIIEHWMGWCPKKQRAKMVSRAVFLSGEMSMKTQKGISSRIKGIAVVVLVLVAALAGMRLEFGSLQSPDWILRDSKAVEGYQWMANNTESDATVLAWWDYADGITGVAHRQAVIAEASREIRNTIGGYTDPSKPWHKIEYALWYPFEPEERVRDVADFFISDNPTSAMQIAEKYGADYALVMADDMGKYFSLIMAAKENLSDYLSVQVNQTSRTRSYPSKETIFTRMVGGEEIEGFSKSFDNGRMRIYKLEKTAAV